MASETRWHLNCFCCQSCSKLLGTETDFRLVSEGSLLCSDCMYSCAACGNKIEVLAILSGDWAFCASCFCCRKCDKHIENTQHARTSQGVFCMSCLHDITARRLEQQYNEEKDEGRAKELHPSTSFRTEVSNPRSLASTARRYTPEVCTIGNKTIIVDDENGVRPDFPWLSELQLASYGGSRTLLSTSFG